MVYRMSTQLERGEAKLREMATTDPLTGAFNRRAVLAHLRSELERAKRQGHAVGVIEADLDHFKLVNDTYGHPAGDAVLVEAVRGITRSLRTYDSVGRLGGEEFLVVAPDVDSFELAALAERIRVAITSAEVAVGEGEPVSVTASLGFTLSNSTDDDGSMLRRVDSALYRAKDAGRNQAVVG
jgi:diguanylate cyclase (GGDEF)-like protein